MFEHRVKVVVASILKQTSDGVKNLQFYKRCSINFSKLVEKNYNKLTELIAKQAAVSLQYNSNLPSSKVSVTFIIKKMNYLWTNGRATKKDSLSQKKIIAK